MFTVGQNVLARNLRGEPKWLPGHIVEQIGSVSYKVQVSDYLWRRHVDQLLQSKSSDSNPSNVSVSESTVVTRPPEIPVLTSMSNIVPIDTDTSEPVPPVEQPIRCSSRPH